MRGTVEAFAKGVDVVLSKGAESVKVPDGEAPFEITRIAPKALRMDPQHPRQPHRFGRFYSLALR